MHDPRSTPGAPGAGPAERGSAPSVPREVYSLAQIQHLARVEFARARRYAYPLVAFELAVDRLGHLRDVFGYELKEDVLGRVIELVLGATRGSDLLGRLPDDRLLLLVPHVDPRGADVLAQRLLGGARKLAFAHAGRTLEVTLSIGGSWTQGGELLFFDALLESAGEARAEAAAAGGDRYVARAPDGTPAP